MAIYQNRGFAPFTLFTPFLLKYSKKESQVTHLLCFYLNIAKSESQVTPFTPVLIQI